MRLNTVFRTLLPIVLTVQTACVTALTVEAETSALRGIEFVAAMPETRIAPSLSCIMLGGETGGTLPDGTRTSRILAECQGRYVLAMTAQISVIDSRASRERIIDTLLLPPLSLWSEQPDAPVLMYYDECELDGSSTQPKIVVVGRWNGRRSIDAHTGVDAAWIMDFDRTGRFIPVDTRRVTCQRDEP